MTRAISLTTSGAVWPMSAMRVATSACSTGGSCCITFAASSVVGRLAITSAIICGCSPRTKAAQAARASPAGAPLLLQPFRHLDGDLLRLLLGDLLGLGLERGAACACGIGGGAHGRRFECSDRDGALDLTQPGRLGSDAFVL